MNEVLHILKPIFCVAADTGGDKLVAVRGDKEKEVLTFASVRILYLHSNFYVNQQLMVLVDC